MLKIEHKVVYQLFKHTIANKSYHITIIYYSKYKA